MLSFFAWNVQHPSSNCNYAATLSFKMSKFGTFETRFYRRKELLHITVKGKSKSVGFSTSSFISKLFQFMKTIVTAWQALLVANNWTRNCIFHSNIFQKNKETTRISMFLNISDNCNFFFIICKQYHVLSVCFYDCTLTTHTIPK